jgi:hypothetical protein
VWLSSILQFWALTSTPVILLQAGTGTWNGPAPRGYLHTQQVGMAQPLADDSRVQEDQISTCARRPSRLCLTANQMAGITTRQLIISHVSVPQCSCTCACCKAGDAYWCIRRYPTSSNSSTHAEHSVLSHSSWHRRVRGQQLTLLLLHPSAQASAAAAKPEVIKEPDSVLLSSGQRMPIIGLGTFQVESADVIK